jgi:hypothetical protein
MAEKPNPLNLIRVMPAKGRDRYPPPELRPGFPFSRENMETLRE